MAKTAVPQFDTTAGNNTDINSVSIAAGYPAPNIRGGMSNLMVLLKNECALLDTVASSGTIDISLKGAWTVSGTTTVTAMTVTSGSRRVLHFQGALTLTHDGSNLILPTGANIVTAAGDCAEFLAIGTNQVRCTSYMRADGTPLVTGTLADSSVTAQKLAVKGNFQPYAQSTPDMTIALAEGTIQAGTALTRIASQNTATITAPVTNPRKDIVYIDAASGVIGVATGAENASPVDPAVPAGKLAVARITLATSTTSITNSLIADLRGGQSGGLVKSSAAAITTSSTDVFAHGLAAAPDDFGAYFVMGSSTELGFTEGDKVPVQYANDGSSGARSVSVKADTTNVTVQWGSSELFLQDTSTGSYGAMDYTKWTVVLWARS